jgi:hypothetical protein
MGRRPQNPDRTKVAASDGEEIAALVVRITEVQARLASFRVTLDRWRAELDGAAFEPPPPAPIAVTAEPPSRTAPRRRGPAKKAVKTRTETYSGKKHVLPGLVPVPIHIQGDELTCRFGNRTIRLPLTSEVTDLPGGLSAEVRRIATSRFAGLAVYASVKLPNPKRGRPPRQR